MKQFKLTSPWFVSAAFLLVSTFSHSASKDYALYNWTGLYLGVNAGAVKHTMHVTDNQATTFFATIQQEADPQFTGGFQLGYRKQLDPIKTSGVFGLEFSADFANADFTNDYGSPYALYQLHAENQLRDLLLLQLIGGIAADRTLLFLAAGLSWTKINGSMRNTDGIPFFHSFSVAKKALGTAVGGGIEYAFSDRISGRAKVDAIFTNPYSRFDDTGSIYQISNTIVQGTLAVNYKFG